MLELATEANTMLKMGESESTGELGKKWKNIRTKIKADSVFAATASKPDKEQRSYKSDETFAQRLEQWQKQVDTFREMTKGMSYDEALELLQYHYAYKNGKDGEPALREDGTPNYYNPKTGSKPAGYKERVKLLKELYGK